MEVLDVVGCLVTKIKRFPLLAGGSLEDISALYPKITFALKTRENSGFAQSMAGRSVTK